MGAAVDLIIAWGGVGEGGSEGGRDAGNISQ